MACRICGGTVREVLDLGRTPPANSLLTAPSDHIDTHPLVLEHCAACGNLQLRDCLSADALYKDYLYVTPRSEMLRAHYQFLLDHLSADRRLDRSSFVLEIGSNVGHFLAFLKPAVAKVLGVDPARNIAALANGAGIETIADFFGAASAEAVARSHGRPDLIVARHCFAHNCSPHDMMAGVTRLLDDDGCFVIENAYGLTTLEHDEFDQVYHEHMFYYTVQAMTELLARHGMRLIDVVFSKVHGGSIVFVAQKRAGSAEPKPTVEAALAHERQVLTPALLERFAANTRRTKVELGALVRRLHAEGKRIYSYGATAKGNTLLNYIGLSHAEIARCVDSTEIKQGRYLPLSNIPVISEAAAAADPPDYYLLTAWNYKDEIIGKVRAAGNATTKFIVPIPAVTIV